MRLSLAGRVAPLVLAFLALAAPAAAGATSPEPTSDAGRPMIETFASIGRDFWAGRDVHPAADLVLDVVRAPCGHPEADGCVVEGLGGRTIELRAGLVRAATRERWQRGRGGDSERLALCVTVVHEEGHSGGLAHSDGGIMDPIAAAAPWGCRAWLAHAERAERASVARRRSHR